MTGEPTRITLLTQADCHLCDHAKEVLGRVAKDHPLQVDEVGLASEPGRSVAAEAGVLFAPGILIDGTPFSFGRLSERKLRKALSTRP